MKRASATVCVVVCLAGFVADGSVSSAQDSTTSSTTSSTVPSDSTSTTTSTTAPGTSTTVDPGSTTTVPGGPTTTLPDGVTVPPIDPLVPLPPDGGLPHEDEELDDPTALITPKGPWDGVGITNPVLAGLRAQVDLTQNKLIAAQTAVAQATDAVTAAQEARDQVEGAQKFAADRYAAVRDRFSRRVAASYVAAGQPELRLRPGRDLSAEADRVVLPGAVTESDRSLADQYLREREQVSEQLRTTIEAETAATQMLDGARLALAAAEAAATEAERQLAASPATIAGFVFPVAGPTSFISSYGYCRDGCSRSHQGNDLFARAGTPVVAVEDGWVEKLGTNRLGGLTVWTRGRSGYRYYYAHLRDWAPLVAGQPILAGTVIGTVGDTGNAKGTSPHLHFEIHPGGTSAIDPYPILIRAPRVTLTPEQVATAAGWSLAQAELNQTAPPPPGG